MMTRYVRQPGLLIAIFLVVTTLALAAQQPNTAIPTTMDAFNNRPVVKSPNGKLGVTVTGPKESYGAWVTINPSMYLGHAEVWPIRVWPIEASVDVLWRPDSQAFALTDHRYANRSYVLIFGTEFRMGESGEGLGVPVTDLTPVVRAAFAEKARKYYQSDNYDIRLFYAWVLRWNGNNNLLVEVSALTSGPVTFPNRGLKEWTAAYLVDVPHKTVVREVGKEQLLTEYKIKISN